MENGYRCSKPANANAWGHGSKPVEADGMHFIDTRSSTLDLDQPATPAQPFPFGMRDLADDSDAER